MDWREILEKGDSPASPFTHWGVWGTQEQEPLDVFSFLREDLKEPELSETQKKIVETIVGIGGIEANPVVLFDPSTRPLESILYLGKGSGKGLIAVNMVLYLIYMLHHLPSPPMEFFNLSPSDDFSIVFVATNRSQAGKSLGRLVNRLVRSRFFNQFPIVRKGRIINRATANKTWPEITVSVGVSGDGIVHFAGIGLGVQVVPSKNESFEGLTLIGWVMDEASGFTTENGIANANSIYRTLKTSVRELPYIGIITSFPRLDAQTDFTHRKFLSVVGDDGSGRPLKREGTTEDGRVFAIQRFTWEVKPARMYSGQFFEFSFPEVGIVETVRVPIEYKREFETDPYNAVSKYMCIPVGYAEQKKFAPLILRSSPKHLVADSSELGYEPPLLTMVTEDPAVEGVETRTGIRYVLRYPVGLIRPTANISIIRQHTFLIGLDAGETDCSAVIAVGHPVFLNNRPIVYIDHIIRYVPDPKRRVYVDLLNFFHVAVHISEILGVEHIKSDKWQSAPFKYTVVDWNDKPVNKADYMLAREMLYNGLIRFAREEDAELFLSQFKQLVDVKEKSKPRVVSGGYQDVVDAVVGVVFWLKELWSIDIKTLSASGEPELNWINQKSKKTLPVGEVGVNPHRSRTLQSSPFIKPAPAVGTGLGESSFPNVGGAPSPHPSIPLDD